MIYFILIFYILLLFIIKFFDIIFWFLLGLNKLKKIILQLYNFAK